MERFGGACVEITNPDQFFGAVTRMLDGWTADGVRKIASFRTQPCQYIPREQTWPDVIAYDPVFRKAPEFSHQSEVRSVWYTSVSPISPKNLDVPGIRSWCRRIA